MRFCDHYTSFRQRKKDPSTVILDKVANMVSVLAMDSDFQSLWWICANRNMVVSYCTYCSFALCMSKKFYSRSITYGSIILFYIHSNLVFRKAEEGLFIRAGSNRTRETFLNWKRVDLDWILGRNYLLWEWWDTGTGYPVRLWIQLPGSIWGQDVWIQGRIFRAEAVEQDNGTRKDCWEPSKASGEKNKSQVSCVMAAWKWPWLEEEHVARNDSWLVR